jgi:hypothetical protein
MTINQDELNNYFAGPWRNRMRGLEEFRYTGYSLIDKIQDGERVLDVGCGMNLFKNRIPNLIGIDPAFPEADVQVSLEEYAKEPPVIRFNVAFCLGSINFGTRADIEHQIDLLVNQLLRTKESRIYWRTNPQQYDHGNQEQHSLPFYNWSFDEHHRLAEQFGFRVNDIQWDTRNRIYAEWVQI